MDYDCDIIDTAGQVRPPSYPLLLRSSDAPCLQDEYTILNSKHAIGIHGYVLVYSVTSKKSFDMVQVVYDKIINFCGMNQIPCVIVGSKTDLQKRYVPQLVPRAPLELTRLVLKADKCPSRKDRSLRSRRTQRTSRRARRQIPTLVSTPIRLTSTAPC